VSEETIKQTVEARFSSGWSATEIAWENVEPRDHSKADAPFLYDGSDPYISVEISAESTDAVFLGENCRRYYGHVGVDIHIPENTGSRVKSQLTDALNTLLQYKELANGVRLKEYTNVGGGYELRKGWVTYSALWPLEAEFT